MVNDVRILTKGLEPIKFLKIISESDYEEIIGEWRSGYLKTKYERVEIIGGPGDKGRDVICTINKAEKKWENFQCKHYDRPLKPSDIWVEIGKLIINVYEKTYTCPKKYYFVSPCGVGIKLRDLLEDEKELKEELIKNWSKSCLKKISDKKQYPLESNLLKFVKTFNFSIFGYISPQEFIKEFEKTSYYNKRFGGLIKPRPLKEEFPNDVQDNELVYIRKILDAYSNHLKKNLKDAKELSKYPELKKHFERQRRNFYSAEYLKAYSRVCA